VSAKTSVDLSQDPKLIVGSRTFDAPRGLVFSAWTSPEHLLHWWGPDEFSLTTHSFEFRPGGIWRFVMHGPDGRDYQNRVTFDEIVPPERIAYHHGGGDVEPVQFRTLVTFEDLGAQTRVTLRATFRSEKERARVIKEYGADKGMVQTLARLAHYIARMLAGEGETAKRSGALGVQPYLFFEGRCEEALEFYKKALGAEVDTLLRVKDSPEPPKPGTLPPGSESKILHASCRVAGSALTASDGHAQGRRKFEGFSLAISARTEAEVVRMFNALADGGTIRLPLTKTFFSPKFGMVADRFGVGWMILVQP
jgi:PhnB protein